MVDAAGCGLERLENTGRCTIVVQDRAQRHIGTRHRASGTENSCVVPLLATNGARIVVTDGRLTDEHRDHAVRDAIPGNRRQVIHHIVVVIFVRAKTNHNDRFAGRALRGRIAASRVALLPL
jgi:hypothetical protein